MNILMLSEASYPRHPGGAGKSTHVLAAGLAARGHEVRILCPCSEPTEIETIDGVEVHRVNLSAADGYPRSLHEAGTAQLLLAHAETHIPVNSLEVVYDSGGFLSYLSRVANELKRRYGPAFVLHYRYLMARDYIALEGDAFDPFGERTFQIESLMRHSPQDYPARFADAVICPTQSDAQFVDTMFRPAGPTTVVNEPIDLERAEAKAVKEFRDRIAKPNEELVFYGGRIDSPLKGAGVVAEAFQRVIEKRPQARLIVCTNNDDALGPFEKVLSQVIRVPWTSDPHEIRNLLALCDLVAVPSRYESFGMLCPEALAQGTPVVGSPVGCMPSLIEPGQNGFLLGPDRERWEEELADYTLMILSDDGLRSRLSKRAPDSVRHLSLDPVIANVEEVIESARLRNRERTSRTPVTPPELSGEMKQKYLASLERWLGEDSVRFGEEVLETWSATAEARCQRCTQAGVSGAVRHLVSLRAQRGEQASEEDDREWSEAVEEAVSELCPVGLLQRELLLEELVGVPGEPTSKAAQA